jgi:phospholipase C
MTSLGKIDHFVVLMLENRSFDHMFGFRHGVHGLKGSESNPRNGRAGEPVRVAEGAGFEITAKHALGPLHNVVDVNEQLFGNPAVPRPGEVPKNNGFVKNYLKGFRGDTGRNPNDDEIAEVMRSFTPGALPSITALADAFCLFDNWYCEVPGPTHPNRLYIHAGTSSGYAHNVFGTPNPSLTIYELLQVNAKTWATYSFDFNEVRDFTRLAGNTDSFRKFNPQFLRDVESGQLPNYSFILPRFISHPHQPENSQHAPHDVRYADHLIADIYEMLRSSRALWEKCAFIVTYDEHGGYYDHAPPPSAENPDGIVSPRPDDFQRHGHSAPPVFAFDRLGPRVPAIIASPWVEKGVVVSEQYQHTSVLRTVRERFAIERSLSRREAAARSFSGVFSRTTPRTDTPEKLPRAQLDPLPPPDHHRHPANQPLDHIQREMVDAVVAQTRASHPEDEDRIWLPKTQGEAAIFFQERLDRHLIHQHQVSGTPRV